MMELNCESVCIAALALADGETPLLQADQVEAHLRACATCRQEVEQVRAMTRLLAAQRRRKPQEQIWTMIEGRLNVAPVHPESPFEWRAVLFLCFILFGYKVILMFLEHDPGIWFRLIPVLFVIAVFTYLKENPFKINSELRLEGE
jgi:hypothetical protein